MNSDDPPIPEGAGGRRRLYCAVASTARPNYYVLLRGVPYCALGVTKITCVGSACAHHLSVDFGFLGVTTLPRTRVVVCAMCGGCGGVAHVGVSVCAFCASCTVLP